MRDERGAVRRAREGWRGGVPGVAFVPLTSKFQETEPNLVLSLYSCFEIVKMTKIEKSHFTKKIIRTTADSVLFPSAVRGLKVSLLRADVAPPRRCLGGQVEAKMLQNLVLKSMSLLRGLVPLPT